MDRQFINKVLEQVRKRMKTFDVPGYRQSRRVEGMFDRDDECYGFKNLCVYIDTGLAGWEDVVSEILGQIDAFIYGKEHYNHTRWLMFFGTDPDKLIAPGASRVYQAIRASAWRGSLARYIGAISSDVDALLPRLHNQGSINTHFPGLYDLAILFCKGRNIRTTEEQQKNFAAIRSRSIWFFCENGDLPMIEVGGFIPQVIEDCNSTDK